MDAWICSFVQQVLIFSSFSEALLVLIDTLIDKIVVTVVLFL